MCSIHLEYMLNVIQYIYIYIYIVQYTHSIPIPISNILTISEELAWHCALALQAVEFGRQIEEQKVQMMQMQVQAVQAAQATPRDLVMHSLVINSVMSHVIPSFLGQAQVQVQVRVDRVEESFNRERSISCKNAVFLSPWGTLLTIAIARAVPRIRDFLQARREIASTQVATEIGLQKLQIWGMVMVGICLCWDASPLPFWKAKIHRSWSPEFSRGQNSFGGSGWPRRPGCQFFWLNGQYIGMPQGVER